MEEIHKKCKSAIDNQNIFLLSYIPGLKSLISTENSLYVDQIFPKYHYMNLLQYSVAAKKPKSLEFLLDFALKTCGMPLNKIIIPTQTPPRDMNLIALAIEFKSNPCLKILKQFILKHQDNENKFDFDIEDQFGETPLIKALRDRNDEASLILVNECNADLLHKANEEKSTLRPLLPIVVFFIYYSSSDEINRLWKQIKKEKRDKIIDELNKLKFDNNFRIDENGEELKRVFQQKQLMEARIFIDSLREINIGPHQTFESVQKEDQDNQPAVNPSYADADDNSDDNDNTNSLKCSNCSNNYEELCSGCNKRFCSVCFSNHKCEKK